jgi:hypothetical protein
VSESRTEKFSPPENSTSVDKLDHFSAPNSIRSFRRERQRSSSGLHGSGLIAECENLRSRSGDMRMSVGNGGPKVGPLVSTLYKSTR